MQLFKSLALASLANIAPGAHAAEKTHSYFRSNKQISAPPSLNVVVESLAKYLWSDSRPRPFLVKGSYPASVWIKEHSHLEILSSTWYLRACVLVLTSLTVSGCCFFMLQGDEGEYRDMKILLVFLPPKPHVKAHHEHMVY